MKLFLLSFLTMTQMSYAAIDYQLFSNSKINFDKSLQEQVMLTALKIKATFGGGTGSVTVIREKESKLINIIQIDGSLSTTGAFSESIKYEDFKQGRPLNFYIEGHNEPRMIIEAHIETLNDVKGGKAQIKYLTRQGYQTREVSIWPDSKGQLRLWDESSRNSQIINTLLIKVNPITLKVIDLIYE